MSEKQNLKTPAPLYEDPVCGGPSDPCLIREEETGIWWMFYTQRRAAGWNIGVSAVHGTSIGIAVSEDGKNWLYRGRAEGLEFEWGQNTFWAPEVIYANDAYHMFVSYIRGIPSNWSGKARIIHYTSDNLWKWSFSDVLDLHSDRVIDACAFNIGNGIWKLWYKDEKSGSHTAAALSHDLKHWTLLGEEITDCPHEGPNVFVLGGHAWMITDTWSGLGVYSSYDYEHWERQEGNLLAKPGRRPGDGEIGNHADVVVSGDLGYLFYFVHPDYPAEMRTKTWFSAGPKEQHTVIQCAVLRVKDGVLVCDRDEDFDISYMK